MEQIQGWDQSNKIELQMWSDYRRGSKPEIPDLNIGTVFRGKVNTTW